MILFEKKQKLDKKWYVLVFLEYLQHFLFNKT